MVTRIRRRGRFWGVWLSAALVLVGCAAPPSVAPGGDAAARPTGPTRATAVVRGDVPTLVPGAAGPVPGLAELSELVNVGLTTFGPGSAVHPRVADEVPTTENGLWKVSADGRMETTWKIRRNAFWHDGAPVTADDFVFRAKVYQDERMPFAGGPVFRFIERIDALFVSKTCIPGAGKWAKRGTRTSGA